MARNSFHNRKHRLDQLLGLLNSRDYWTTADLSASLGVSRRTLVRDLGDLSDSGVPVESDRGRGGGVRISRSWGLGRVQLSPSEILTLLVSLAAMEKMDVPLLVQDTRSIRNKLHRAFPAEERQVVETLRRRIKLAPAASRSVLDNYTKPRERVIAPIQAAFFERRCVEITYRDEKNARTVRVIEPHYLIAAWPIWYLQAWDRLRDAIRFFRLDRICEASLCAEAFHVREESVFRQARETFSKDL